MEKTKNTITKTKTIYLLIIIVIECIAIFLTYNSYKQNKEAIYTQFNKRQYLIAKEVSYRIKDFFDNTTDEMIFMATHSSIIQGDEDNCEKNMSFLYEKMKNKALTLRRLDEKGIVTNIFPETMKNTVIGKDESSTIYFTFCKEKGKPFLSSQLIHEYGEKEIHLSVPLFEQKDDGKKIFKGVLSYDFSLQWLTERFVADSMLDKIGYITIMDSAGTLLSNIKHPEMVYNNIFSRSEKCFACHSTFAPLEEMVQKGEGIFKYSVKGESEKFISATSISLPGTKWIIAFNIPVSEIQKIVQNSSKQTRMLILLFISTIVLGFYLLLGIKKEKEILTIMDNNITEATEAREMLEQVIQCSVDGIIIVENTGMIAASNEAANNILGYNENKLKEMHISILASPDSVSLKKRREVLEELFEKGFVKVHETLWKRKNGEIFPVESSNSLFKDVGGNYCGGLIIFRDITARKQMAEALVKAQRLSAVGEIGITVKHEINNPLGGIIGYSELMLKHDENLTEKDKTRTKEILKMAMRIKDVVNCIETLQDTKTVNYIDGIKMIQIEQNGNTAEPDGETPKADKSP